MLINTEGIILKTIDFTESSVISTVFTRQVGKTSVLVRGVKKTKTKYSGLFQPLQHLEVVFTDKPGREIHPITDATFASKWFKLSEDVEKMYLALCVLETIDQVTHQHDPNPELFDFSKVFLTWLNGTNQETWMLLPYLLIKVCSHLGVGLHCNENTSGRLYLNIHDGVFLEGKDSESGLYLTDLQSTYVKTALTGGTASLLNLPISKREVLDLSSIVDRYMRFHIEGIRSRKSDKIFNDILSL